MKKIYFGRHEKPDGGLFYTFGEHEDYKKARSALRKHNGRLERLVGLMPRQLNSEQLSELVRDKDLAELWFEDGYVDNGRIK